MSPMVYRLLKKAVMLDVSYIGELSWNLREILRLMVETVNKF